VRLVGEAVTEFKGDGVAEPTEMRLELPVDAHLPHDYVSSERLRLEIYRRLAATLSMAEVQETRAELVDRFGEPPAAVETLLEVARLRVRIREAGLREVTTAGANVRFAGAVLPESSQLRLRRIYPKSIYKHAAEIALVPHPRTAPVGGTPLRDRELLEWTRTVVDTLVPPA